MILNNDQIKASGAFTQFLMDDTERYFILSGGSGSGKSTLIKHLLDTLSDKYKMINLVKQRTHRELDVYLTATTNKAADVLRVMGNDTPSTIHTLLKLSMKSNFRTGKTDLIKTKKARKLSNSLILIDEASMIDFNDPDPDVITLLDYMEELIDDTCKVVLVGDQYQLAPVGKTTTLMEVLPCPKAELNQVIRNDGIIRDTGQMFKETVKTGIFRSIEPDNDKLIHVSGSDFKSLVSEAFLAEDYHANSAKILAWTNNRVVAYNDHIRAIKGYNTSYTMGETAITAKPIVTSRINIPVEAEVTINYISQLEKLRNIEGYYVTLNNDHTLRFLPRHYSDAKALMKKFAKDKNWHEYFEIKDTWLDLRPAYSSTVAKSQGSTYGTVFIDLSDIGKYWIPSDVARMLYVSITRASDRVVLSGNLPPQYRGKQE